LLPDYGEKKVSSFLNPYHKKKKWEKGAMGW
jgi:hypothetical protein